MMLLIKRIEWMQTEENEIAKIYHYKPHEGMSVVTEEGPGIIEAVVVQEIVKGHRLRRQGFPDIWIGAGQDVDCLLDGVFESLSDMKKETAWQHTRINILEKDKMILTRHYEEACIDLNEINDASLWTRLKWLFTGVTVKERIRRDEKPI